MSETSLFVVLFLFHTVGEIPSHTSCSPYALSFSNTNIAETIYYGACEAVMALAKKEGHCETYPGSPTSKGQFQLDMWGVRRHALRPLGLGRAQGENRRACQECPPG